MHTSLSTMYFHRKCFLLCKLSKFVQVPKDIEVLLTDYVYHEWGKNDHPSPATIRGWYLFLLAFLFHRPRYREIPILIANVFLPLPVCSTAVRHMSHACLPICQCQLSTFLLLLWKQMKEEKQKKQKYVVSCEENYSREKERENSWGVRPLSHVPSQVDHRYNWRS